MSLVEDEPEDFDEERLVPAMDAILAEAVNRKLDVDEFVEVLHRLLIAALLECGQDPVDYIDHMRECAEEMETEDVEVHPLH